MISDFTNQAVQAFNENNYELALQSFKQILEIEDMPLMKDEENPQAVDTVIIFNAGLAAYNAEKYDEAIKYYEEAAKHDYNGCNATFELIASCYVMQQDTTAALETYQRGFEKISRNQFNSGRYDQYLSELQ
ncbi:tetratricopeptide repeat protein [uncultured Sunxiuqinia sp.]|uniref:tetratricopeptide repeat protein n=1 Tax=uncultured Sunxiuqinia sp. TaxID=1573825 RepID=UPI002AA7153F|nr:tetratricopeptide repeat protein [uncultured Sunxiuqinia sp.]